MMHTKITAEHLARSAIVYVRQSTMSQVLGNLESQKRQYQLAEIARDTGFATVQVIDEDLGRSGSGQMARPGFQRLVAEVCAGSVGAVFCIEASRLARNGRDWHHLIDLCALTGALVVDPEGVYDPRLMNDRLLLGLKGTMSEYELNLLRQRGLAARDSKAGRGELRFTLPPGFCWSEDDRIEIDPDERVQQAIRLIFAKFRELGSGRQVFPLRANKSERFDCLKFTLEGAGDRSNGNARTSAFLLAFFARGPCIYGVCWPRCGGTCGGVGRIHGWAEAAQLHGEIQAADFVRDRPCCGYRRDLSHSSSGGPVFFGPERLAGPA
jgi:DNA invertase Pin-like site-specific DNA recombinase